MSSKDSKVKEVTPFQVKREDIFYSAENEIMFSRELHAGSSSHLKLSDEGKLHGSSPTYSDKVNLLFFIHQVLFIHSCMHA